MLLILCTQHLVPGFGRVVCGLVMVGGQGVWGQGNLSIHPHIPKRNQTHFEPTRCTKSADSSYIAITGRSCLSWRLTGATLPNGNWLESALIRRPGWLLLENEKISYIAQSFELVLKPVLYGKIWLHLNARLAEWKPQACRRESAWSRWRMEVSLENTISPNSLNVLAVLAGWGPTSGM